MSNQAHCYYGRVEGPVARPFCDEVIKEEDASIKQILHGIEERVKRHVTECKREIIKELEIMQGARNKDIKPTKIKEQKDGTDTRKRSSKKSDG